MRAAGLLGLALLASVGAQAETPAEQTEREAKNRAFILKHYPSAALAAGEHGIVFFQIDLDRDGRLKGCEVTRSSGFPRLDEGTCDLMVAHGVFKPVRDKSGRRIHPTHEGAINWKLPPGVKPAAVPQKLASLPRPEKLICRRILLTGSTVRTERRCLTAREWEVGDDNGRNELERMQNSFARGGGG